MNNTTQKETTTTTTTPVETPATIAVATSVLFVIDVGLVVGEGVIVGGIGFVVGESVTVCEMSGDVEGAVRQRQILLMHSVLHNHNVHHLPLGIIIVRLLLPQVELQGTKGST